MASPQPTLTHVFDLTVSGPPGFAVAPSEHSSLCCAHVTTGNLTTPDGSLSLVLTSGADWMTVSSTYATIDARLNLVSPPESEKKLNMDIRYLGKIDFSSDVLDVFTGKKKLLDFGEGYYYTAPFIESRSPELAWVNKTVFLAMGRLSVNDDGLVQVTYRIFKVGRDN